MPDIDLSIRNQPSKKKRLSLEFYLEKRPNGMVSLKGVDQYGGDWKLINFVLNGKTVLVPGLPRNDFAFPTNEHGQLRLENDE